MNLASLHFHLLVLFPSPLCFSIILFFLLLMCLPFLPTPFYHSPASSSLFTPSLILSRQNYGAHYPPRPQTNDNNNSEMSSLLSLPLSLFLLLPLSSSLTFSCPSPKVAISHPFPARSTQLEGPGAETRRRGTESRGEKERVREKYGIKQRDPQMSPLHILHLSPPPSPLPAAFLFYLAVFAYSLHPFCGWICCGLSLFDFLLTWVFAGGASRCRLLLWRQSIWALGGKISEELQKYRDSLHLLQQPKLSDSEPISDISKERDSQPEK